MRLEYFKVAPDAIKGMAKASEYLESCSIEADLRALVELRVSQINGCAYCVDLHSQQARRAGIDEQQIDCVSVWHEADIYNDRQKCAFEWADAVTQIAGKGVSDELYQKVSQQFEPKELVDLTTIISMMNAWNRIAISFKRGPSRRLAQKPE